MSMGKRKYTVCDVDDHDGVYIKMCTNFYDNFSYLVFHVRPRNEGEKKSKRAQHSTVGFRFFFVGLYRERVRFLRSSNINSSNKTRQAVGMETSLSEKREDEKKDLMCDSFREFGSDRIKILKFSAPEFFFYFIKISFKCFY